MCSIVNFGNRLFVKNRSISLEIVCCHTDCETELDLDGEKETEIDLYAEKENNRNCRSEIHCIIFLSVMVGDVFC